MTRASPLVTTYKRSAAMASRSEAGFQTRYVQPDSAGEPRWMLSHG
jgi:hypothetical protein